MTTNFISLYTGGSRSGKSRAAVELAKTKYTSACFMATCKPLDEEMEIRVQRHQKERPEDWLLIEEPIHIADRLREVDAQRCPVVIVDCLTLWVSNLMFLDASPLSDEDAVTVLCNNLIDAARSYGGHVIFITNEVGLGVIPENDLARRFVDLAGRCNQTIAIAADEVVLFTCGLPMNIKGGSA